MNQETLMNIKVRILFMLFVGACSTLLTAPSFAGDYFGEGCWVTDDDGGPEEGNDYIKLAFYLVGDTHFSVNGFSFSDGDQTPDERALLSGNAEIAEDQLLLNLAGSSSDSEQMLAITVSAKIALANLNGTFEAIGKVFDRGSQQIVEQFQQGTLTFAACPQI